MSVGAYSAIFVVAGLSLGAAGAMAQQVPAAYVQPGAASSTGPSAGHYERISGRNNAALRYFGGPAPAAYSSPPPRPLPAPQQATPTRPAPFYKPFSGVQQAAAISPYLGLDAVRETETSLPNYFLYVRPQIEQQQVNQVQQAQYRKLQQQVRTAAGPDLAAGPGTAYGPQFMNSGGYYPALRR